MQCGQLRRERLGRFKGGDRFIAEAAGKKQSMKHVRLERPGRNESHSSVIKHDIDPVERVVVEESVASQMAAGDVYAGRRIKFANVDVPRLRPADVRVGGLDQQNGVARVGGVAIGVEAFGQPGPGRARTNYGDVTGAGCSVPGCLRVARTFIFRRALCKQLLVFRSVPSLGEIVLSCNRYPLQRTVGSTPANYASACRLYRRR